MDKLEEKKLKVQLKKIDAAIAELEFKILEREQDIQRMQEHIKMQEKLKLEILEKLEG